jgi:hypothetical protein
MCLSTPLARSPACEYTFRATGITDYLTNGWRIEVAQRMVGQSNAKTFGRFDDVELRPGALTRAQAAILGAF